MSTERGRDIGRGRSRLHPYRECLVGLDPRTPESCPGPKAAAKLLSHAGVPDTIILRAYTGRGW